MALLGLLIAILANKLLTGAPFDYIFSVFSVLFFSALTACQLAPIAFLAADPELRIKPADSLRFSMLAALQLYLSAGNLIAIALSSSPLGPSRYHYYNQHMHHYSGSHYSGIGVGGFGGGAGGGGIGGGGDVGGAGGGGGSFTP